MKTVNIISNDRELYNMLALWLRDIGMELTDAPSAALVILDTESGKTTSAKLLLTVGGADAELKRPFSRLDFTEAVRGKLGEASARVRVDARRRRIYYQRNYITLTEKEYAVFLLLYEKNGALVLRGDISAIAGTGEHETNAADVYICMLRRKLTRLLGDNVIKTVRGLGYELNLS